MRGGVGSGHNDVLATRATQNHRSAGNVSGARTETPQRNTLSTHATGDNKTVGERGSHTSSSACAMPDGARMERGSISKHRHVHLLCGQRVVAKVLQAQAQELFRVDDPALHVRKRSVPAVRAGEHDTESIIIIKTGRASTQGTGCRRWVSVCKGLTALTRWTRVRPSEPPPRPRSCGCRTHRPPAAARMP